MFSVLKCTLTGVAAAALLTGCAAASGTAEKEPEIAAIDAEAAAESVRIGRDAGETLLKALTERQFDLAKALPVGNGKDTLTKEKFDGLLNKVIEPNGGIASYAYLGDLSRGAYRRMLWKVSFQKPVKKLEGVDLLFEVWVGRLDGQLRIVGFQFHP